MALPNFLYFVSLKSFELLPSIPLLVLSFTHIRQVCYFWCLTVSLEFNMPFFQVLILHNVLMIFHPFLSSCLGELPLFHILFKTKPRSNSHYKQKMICDSHTFTGNSNQESEITFDQGVYEVQKLLDIKSASRSQKRNSFFLFTTN